MANQKQLDQVYMGVAELHASLSYAKRLQVGAAILGENDITERGVLSER